MEGKYRKLVHKGIKIKSKAINDIAVHVMRNRILKLLDYKLYFEKFFCFAEKKIDKKTKISYY